MSRDAFLVSPNLRSLNMSHNLLSSLSAPWPPLPSLHTLVLSSNPVASLDLCTLAQLPQLSDLQVKLSRHQVVETRGHDTIKKDVHKVRVVQVRCAGVRGGAGAGVVGGVR